MKKGFTIIEVSILFVIFLIVAFLVAPLSLDDTIQANNISRWRNVQTDFENIFHSLDTQIEENKIDLKDGISTILDIEAKTDLEPYKITYLDGNRPNEQYKFENYKLTQANAVIAAKYYDTSNEDEIIGKIMYDVNGTAGPNTWGKDVFGYNIYKDKFEPFCKNEMFNIQKKDCSRSGTGLCCSNYYLIGGNFE